jgi:hypothetical protein
MAKRVEVVFREDITNVAKKGEGRVGAGGYWRNFLWPGGLAVLAGTKEARKLVGERVVETPPPVPAEPSEPGKQVAHRTRRVTQKEAKKRKESRKSATLRAKVKTPTKGKEK